MVKFTVLFAHPNDPDAFERHYLGVHAPLVCKMPGLRRFETALAQPGLDGAAPPYYRITDLYFDDIDSLHASFNSPEGREGGKDTQNFSDVTLTSMISELDSVPT